LHVISNGTWQQNNPIQKRESGAPLVNNLSFTGNSVAIGPFTLAGTYHLLCLVHRGMNLTITVQ
jgi:plastocyanin